MLSIELYNRAKCRESAGSPVSLQATFDRGSRVTEFARDYVPGGALIDLPYEAFDQRVEHSRRALADGAPAIYEASFRADGVLILGGIAPHATCGVAAGTDAVDHAPR